MTFSRLERLSSLLAAALVLAGPGAAIADDAAYTQAGPYLRAGFVQAWGQFEGPETESGYGLDLTLGGRINRYLAAEVGYEGIFSWTIRGIETSTYAIMADLKRA